MDELAGRTAVVTGAGSGIGLGLAVHAGTLGMNVVLAELDEERLEAAVATVRATGARVLGVPTDVGDPTSVEDLAQTAYATFGDVAVLINNAGIEAVGHVWDFEPERWSRMMRVNTDGAFHGIRSFVPRMGASQQTSYVVNVASVAAVSAGPFNAAYHASKHALLALTECLHLESQIAFPQLQVSVVCPGSVTTRIFEDASLSGDDETGGPRQMLDYLRHMLSTEGLSPAEVAEIVFAGMAAGDFWILPHPEQFAELAGARAEQLLHRRAPALPVFE
ncbi:SDR family NAD(P)-dependent oxidoreductase [Nocardioides sp. BGMRC 2183]|nr:SDR family NAD(P)-dependent oxidoreductase [Nocardioides sp. BGMRC 2183]